MLSKDSKAFLIAKFRKWVWLLVEVHVSARRAKGGFTL